MLRLEPWTMGGNRCLELRIVLHLLKKAITASKCQLQTAVNCRRNVCPSDFLSGKLQAVFANADTSNHPSRRSGAQLILTDKGYESDRVL